MRRLMTPILCATFLFSLTACDDSEGNKKLNFSKIRLSKVNSCEELSDVISRIPVRYISGGDGIALAAPTSSEADSASTGETNVQVSGVDEMDRTKAVGPFIYSISSDQQSLVVLNRESANATVVQTVSLTGTNFSPSGLFVTESKVILLGQSYEAIAYEETRFTTIAPYYSGNKTQLLIFPRQSDGRLGEPSDEQLIDGSLLAARMIGSRLHLALSAALPEEECSNIYYEPAILDADSPIAYWGGEMLCVSSLDTSDSSASPQGECLLANSGSTIYASEENMFIATYGGIATPIHQFHLASDDSPTEYVGSALPEGALLNSFSMDEHDGHLRVATTVWNTPSTVNGEAPDVSSSQQSSQVRIFRLTGDDLEETGGVDNLGKGESIYAVRFLGDRGFVVTFKKVDPLYALDLSNPSNPRLRGELKIPGYSTYLHPMEDPGFLLAIGKDAEQADEGDFAWYQGMALSIFDVRDLDNPKLVQKIGIGGRGTESEALHDHHAFRYIAEEGLVLFPIDLYEGGSGQFDYGTFTFSGFHIYSATVANGFSLVGTSELPLGSYGARSFYREGELSLVGGGELAVRAAGDPDVDLARIVVP